jgi:hypothetical protein
LLILRNGRKGTAPFERSKNGGFVTEVFEPEKVN